MVEFENKNDYKTYDKAPIKDSGTFDLSSQGGPNSIPYQEDFTSKLVSIYEISLNNRKYFVDLKKINIFMIGLSGRSF